MRSATELEYTLGILSYLNALCMSTRREGKVMYGKYRYFRLWFVDKMIEHDIDFTSLPQVKTKTEFIELKNQCKRRINLRSFASVKSHEFDIEFENGKIKAYLPK